jgi:hypothetical protein
MKKKYTPDGKPYLFSTDEFVEGLCLALISNLHKVNNPEVQTLEDRLWEASFHYLEDCDSDSSIFTNTMLGLEYSQDKLIYANFQEAIKTIMSYIPLKEKKVMFEFNEGYLTKHNILVRETKDGKYIALKFFTDGLIMNKKDYQKLFNDIQIDIEDMSAVQFNRLEYNIRMTLGENYYFDRYKSLRCFKESLSTEKELNPNNKSIKVKYDINSGFVSVDELIDTTSLFTIL